MNTATRSALDLEPIPVEGGIQARSCVVIDDDGQWRTAWQIGLRKEPFGPAYPSGKAATQASLHVNARVTG